MFKESNYTYKKTIKVDLPKEVESAFKNLDDFELHSLEDHNALFQIRNDLMKNEYEHLKTRYGKDHLRTTQMATLLKTNEGTISNLRLAEQIGKVSVPSVPTGCLIIHGFILNKQLEGINNIQVCNQRTDRVYLSTKTNESGYFSFILSPKQVGKLKHHITLVVFNNKGEQVYCDERLEINSLEIRREIILDDDQCNMCCEEKEVKSTVVKDDENNEPKKY